MLLHRQASFQFSHSSIFLHWVIAISMMGSMAIQYYAVYFAKETMKMSLYMMHRSLGLVSVVLSIFLILIKIVDRRPPVTEIPSSVVWLYKVTRYSLFLLPIVLFGSGWLIFDLKDKDFYFFGHLLHGPDLFTKNIVGSIEARLHHKLFCAYAVLIVVGHGGAALVHLFVMKDTILWRMLPLRILLPKTSKEDALSKD